MGAAAMVKALALAFRWRKMVDEGVHATLEDLAKSKGIAKTYVSQILRLTLLAPGLVEAILDGRQPAELLLGDLLEGFPVDWEGNEDTSRSAAGSRGWDVNQCCFDFGITRPLSLGRPESRRKGSRVRSRP